MVQKSRKLEKSSFLACATPEESQLYFSQCSVYKYFNMFTLYTINIFTKLYASYSL